MAYGGAQVSVPDIVSALVHARFDEGELFGATLACRRTARTRWILVGLSFPVPSCPPGVLVLVVVKLTVTSDTRDVCTKHNRAWHDEVSTLLHTVVCILCIKRLSLVF